MTVPHRLRRVWSRLLRHLRGGIIPGSLRSAVAFSAALTTLASCMEAMTPRGKLDEAVQETAMASRFGRHDIAAEHVALGARAAFLRRHKLWGGEVRIVDVELGGMEKNSQKEAVVLVGFSWFRPTEGTLRATVVRQTWKNDEGTGPWFLVDEERASGDVGLLGEPNVVVLAPANTGPRHFETHTIKEK